MKTIKNIFSNIYVQGCLLLMFVILGTAMVHNVKSSVKYLDFPCPVCGSAEVGDFGHDIRYNDCQKGHCFDCGTEFYIEDYNE